MTVLVTLTLAGLDTGPFDLYSDADGYTTPLASGVAKATLETGYSLTGVPDIASVIRAQSTGACTNYLDMTISGGTTTTTTSSTTSSTTSTTSTTTTLAPPGCTAWDITAGSFGTGWEYIPCGDISPTSVYLEPGESMDGVCAETTYGMNNLGGNGTKTNVGGCR
jgi:hypothetical protein